MSVDLSTFAPETRHLQTVSLVEAGELLGIKRTFAYKLARRNEFPVPVLDVVGKKRVRVVDLENLLEALASL